MLNFSFFFQRLGSIFNKQSWNRSKLHFTTFVMLCLENKRPFYLRFRRFHKISWKKMYKKTNSKHFFHRDMWFALSPKTFPLVQNLIKSNLLSRPDLNLLVHLILIDDQPRFLLCGCVAIIVWGLEVRSSTRVQSKISIVRKESPLDFTLINGQLSALWSTPSLASARGHKQLNYHAVWWRINQLGEFSQGFFFLLKAVAARRGFC